MMRIAIVGTRGIPAAYGGFETLAERLALGLHALGHQVTVLGNSGSGHDRWQGIKRIPTRFQKQDHPVLFYLESLRLSRQGFDRVLVCGVGGAPFYSLYPMKEGVRITHVDGLEHLRDKFSSVKKWYVRKAQRLLSRSSAPVVSDSAAVTAFWREELEHKGLLRTIMYGADIVTVADRSLLPESLVPGEYYLVVARPVPENNLAMIARAWSDSGTPKHLVIVGSTGKEMLYDLLSQADRERILFTGPVYDKMVLAALRFHAFAYLHGHSVGGTNPALVEAMATAAICLCHDNPFNRETTAGAAIYFSSDKELSSKLIELEQQSAGQRQAARLQMLQLAQERYSWERIVDQYLELFELAGR